MITPKTRKAVAKKPVLGPVLKEQKMTPVIPLPPPHRHVETKYVELIADRLMDHTLTPVGAGYPEFFDEAIDVTGWKEIRVWVHVFVENYKSTPINTSAARLELRFLHNFAGGSFDYDKQTFQTNVTSYIDGFAVKPILGNTLRMICHPENLPMGPYRLSVTYLLA